jgi:8-oxo-dGTP diphosphatase
VDRRYSKRMPDRVADIDWQQWHPVDRGTLLFVICDGQVLLIHKKRGLGAGKINGPGGRMDDGETPFECAIREVAEELLISPSGVAEIGELQFQFLDGYSIHVWVFRAESFAGTPQATEEAEPLWTPLEDIPYDEMWADDRIWLPLLLEGRPFLGRFIFDGDRMLDHDLIER